MLSSNHQLSLIHHLFPLEIPIKKPWLRHCFHDIWYLLLYIYTYVPQLYVYQTSFFHQYRNSKVLMVRFQGLLHFSNQKVNRFSYQTKQTLILFQPKLLIFDVYRKGSQATIFYCQNLAIYTLHHHNIHTLQVSDFLSWKDRCTVLQVSKTRQKNYLQIAQLMIHQNSR